ncbi:hypothetical protein QLS71_011375 [Mariniflexile litorale]|uniref:DinB family protein n=1 Tax=Mariniflexile litorale TaxID=3045158 RepID=A0AAU7EBD4_9FLAO|nr:hypothetical protein [Mariniflexile sp. KMM 9835]MDQ8212950.1 hypothetical protein [Mariniflexile sp. KMM 9835]
MKQFVCVFILVSSIVAMAQTKDVLPYYEIPEYDEVYTANSVAARMIDGLGFRYYWATEGLRDEDLNYKPNESGRATSDIVEHIYGLSKFIRNSILNSNKNTSKIELIFEEKRKQTLMNFKAVSDILRNTETPFQLEAAEVPFWNIINGPVSDALWHCGQVVLLRRASGNPFSSKVNLFSGKVKK